MIIFDGNAFALEKEEQLRQEVALLHKQGKALNISAILFTEDEGSILYTRKKREAAQRIGITYQAYSFSLLNPIEDVINQIKELNTDPAVTGIIIQKPWRQTYQNIISPFGGERQAKHGKKGDGVASTDFADWWSQLTPHIAETKDIDGLHPDTIHAIKNGTWKQTGKVLPATCSAVLSIVNEIPNTEHRTHRVAIIGRSDLLGTPLYFELKNLGWHTVDLFGKKELQQKIDSGEGLKNYRMIISATGQPQLITDQLIADNTIIIDAGEPRGDVNFDSVKDKVSFITPVPGGVGPVTVVSLLENCLKLAYNAPHSSNSPAR